MKKTLIITLLLSTLSGPAHGMLRVMTTRLARATQAIRAQAPKMAQSGVKIAPVTTQAAQKLCMQAVQQTVQTASLWERMRASLSNAWAYVKQRITIPNRNQICTYAKKVAANTTKAIGPRMPFTAGIIAASAAQAQGKEKKITQEEVFRYSYDVAYRKQALDFALANITAQDAETIEVIIAILERYRESHKPIVKDALAHFNNTHPLLIKNILAHNAWAADEFVEQLISTENPHLEKLFSDNKDYQWTVMFYEDGPIWSLKKLVLTEILKKESLRKNILEKLSAEELINAHYQNNYSWFKRYIMSKNKPAESSSTLAFYLYFLLKSHCAPSFQLDEPQSSYGLAYYLNPSLNDIKKTIYRDIKKLPTKHVNYAYEVIFESQLDKEHFQKTVLANNKYNTIDSTKNILQTTLQSYDEIPIFLPLECSQNNHIPTHSEKHFCANVKSVLNVLKQYDVKKTNAAELFMKAITKERKELSKGNHVFYHGRRWEWDLASDIYKGLYNAINNVKNPIGDDYTFLRFDDSIGTYGPALFLNAPLFGSVSWWGNSTAQLILSGFDWSRSKAKKFTPQELFARFNAEKSFSRYENEFKKLAVLHQQANPSNIGSLLMVSIDDTNANMVYPVQKYANNPKPVTLSSGEATLETKKILAELKAGVLPGGGDTIEYVLPLTEEYALDPEKGPRIYAMNACDPTKYKEYTDFRDQLFAKIRADMQQNGGNIS